MIVNWLSSYIYYKTHTAWSVTIRVTMGFKSYLTCACIIMLYQWLETVIHSVCSLDSRVGDKLESETTGLVAMTSVLRTCVWNWMGSWILSWIKDACVCFLLWHRTHWVWVVPLTCYNLKQVMISLHNWSSMLMNT